MLLLPCAMQGQNLWNKFLVWVREGNIFDSTYIYQRPAGVQASIDASVQQFTSSLKADLVSTITPFDENGNPLDPVVVPSSSRTDIKDIVNGSIGVGFAYGRLGLSFGILSWPKSRKNSVINLNLGYQGNKWGIHLGLNGLEQRATNTTTVGTEDYEYYRHTEYLSDSTLRVLRMSADAYWVINRNRFSYTSAYKCDMAQRRSVGSVLISASLVNFFVSSEGDAILASLPEVKSYGAFINSIGAGYSYNFVFKHRDPTGPNNEGLFNLTLNMTLLPMLTYSSTIYARPLNDELFSITSSITPNICGNAALGMYLGQWFFSIQYHHNVYFFSSKKDLTPADLEFETLDFDKLNLNGLMQEWKVSTIAIFNF